LGYLQIKKSESNISLNNSGKEEITLTDPTGVVVASLQYEDAPKEESYNYTADGTYAWSTKLTPGTENIIDAHKSIPKTLAKKSISNTTVESDATFTDAENPDLLPTTEVPV